ncbi:MAG: efflux RND transporter periplasmic adaptor subunit [Desulfuromonadaceae bacterium]
MQWKTCDTKTGLITGAFLCGMLVMFGCKKEKPAPPPPPTVEVTAVTVKDVPIYKEWIGTLDGNVNAVIRPQVSGYLIKQNYQEGQLVKKGQVLFEIDPRTFQASLDQAKAQLAQQQARYDTSKANLARIKPLAAKNAVSQKDLDDATGTELSTRSSVESAQAALENARLNLSFTKVTSPVDGIAGIAKTQLGNLVGPSSQQELTTVSSVNPIKAYINVSEREYLSAREGSQHVGNIPLELILADGSVYPHKGKFSLADRQVDPTTGTLKIGTLFANQNNLLRPGQYGRVRAAVGLRKAALLVPQRAVAEMQGKYLVAIVKADNTADIRPVKVAEQIGTQWVITEGLQPGDKIVVEGIQKVRPGSPVIPQPYNPDGQAKTVPAAPEAKPGAPAKQEKR